ncbi:lysophospholipase [Myxococcota bacterium]|nr:lysophospholipase [Myxococcota bacterium]
MFNTTQAARDLAAVIDRTRENGVPVIVYGVSYGTYWALRYLRLYPTHSDGVILDSICAPGHCTLDEYDRNFDENGMMVMDACLSDATCGAKLSTIDADPWTAVGNVFAKMDAGTLCDGEYPFLDRPLVRQVLAMMEAFITDPTAAVDSSCLSELYPLEFSADSELNMALSSAYFGTSDMYEGAVQKSSPAPFTPPLNPVRAR